MVVAAVVGVDLGCVGVVVRAVFVRRAEVDMGRRPAGRHEAYDQDDDQGKTQSMAERGYVHGGLGFLYLRKYSQKL